MILTKQTITNFFFNFSFYLGQLLNLTPIKYDAKSGFYLERLTKSRTTFIAHSISCGSQFIFLIFVATIFLISVIDQEGGNESVKSTITALNLLVITCFAVLRVVGITSVKTFVHLLNNEKFLESTISRKNKNTGKENNYHCIKI